MLNTWQCLQVSRSTSFPHLIWCPNQFLKIKFSFFYRTSKLTHLYSFYPHHLQVVFIGFSEHILCIDLLLPAYWNAQFQSQVIYQVYSYLHLKELVQLHLLHYFRHLPHCHHHHPYHSFLQFIYCFLNIISIQLHDLKIPSFFIAATLKYHHHHLSYLLLFFDLVFSY